MIIEEDMNLRGGYKGMGGVWDEKGWIGLKFFEVMFEILK